MDKQRSIECKTAFDREEECQMLFHSFMAFKSRIHILAAIVQNPGMNISDEDIEDRQEQVRDFKTGFDQLIDSTLKYYGKEPLDRSEFFAHGFTSVKDLKDYLSDVDGDCKLLVITDSYGGQYVHTDVGS